MAAEDRAHRDAADRQVRVRVGVRVRVRVGVWIRVRDMVSSRSSDHYVWIRGCKSFICEYKRVRE